MKYLLSYMTMLLTMFVTIMCGAGFTTVVGLSILALIFSSFFWNSWLKTLKKTERRASV